MHYIFLMRHANSPANIMSDDYLRALNKKGIEQAQISGRFLQKNYVEKLDHVIISPSLRTKQTWQYMNDQEGVNLEKHCSITEHSDILYRGSSDQIIDFIAQIFVLKPKTKSIFLLGHNPTINETAFNLLDLSYHEHFVTHQSMNARIVILVIDQKNITEYSNDMASESKISYIRKSILNKMHIKDIFYPS